MISSFTEEVRPENYGRMEGRLGGIHEVRRIYFHYLRDGISNCPTDSVADEFQR